MKTYHNLAQAKRIADNALQLLQTAFTKIHIAGSTRRETFKVADIELVGIPHSTDAFKSRTDKLRLDKTIVKHDYRPTDPIKSYRWGDKYRGFDFQNMLVEVFIASNESFGYIYWLRTGPGKANTTCMTYLSRALSPIRTSEGQVWHVEYHNKHSHDYRKVNALNVPDEQTMFQLLNIPYIEPSSRCQEYYDWHMGNNDWTPPNIDYIKSLYISSTEPVQLDMF